MDKQLLKKCYEEIKNLVLDSNKQINIITMSKLYGIPVMECEKLLVKFVNDDDMKNYQFTKEYLIRGILNDVHYMTIVHDKQLEEKKNAFKNPYAIMFSIELTTETKRHFKPFERLPQNTNINLPYSCGIRKIESLSSPPPPPPPPPPPTTTNEKPITNGCTLKKSPIPPTKEVKTEKISPAKNENLKEEDKHKQNTKKEITKSSSSTKAAIPSQSSSSIASFFSKKPKGVTTTTPATTVDQKKSIPPPTTEITLKIEKNHSTRSNSSVKTETHSEIKPNLSICDTDDDDDGDDNLIPVTPKEVEKIKRQKKTKSSSISKRKPTVRNRIIVEKLSSSSDDEDDEKLNEANKKELLIDDDDKGDVMIIEEEQKEGEDHIVNNNNDKVGDVKSVASIDSERRQNTKGRCKKIREVSRTVQDDDGYFVTVREKEQYSCTDDEYESPEKLKKSNQDSVPTGFLLPIETNKKEVVDKGKKVIAAAADKKKLKNVSITNFFTKK